MRGWLLAGALDCAESVNDDIERTFRDDAWIELFERPGGGVSRVGESVLPGGFALGIQFLES